MFLGISFVWMLSVSVKKIKIFILLYMWLTEIERLINTEWKQIHIIMPWTIKCILQTNFKKIGLHDFCNLIIQILSILFLDWIQYKKNNISNLKCQVHSEEY